MELNKVIFKPVLTEKALALRDRGVWSFYVHPKATKGAVKRAVEEFFGVHPQKIRTIILNPKTKNHWKVRRKVSLKKRKKALIWLPDGEKIKNV